MRLVILFYSLTIICACAQVKWPDGHKAAIVLTYDDAMECQLTYAVPQLNKYKLHGTFFLAGWISTNDMLLWRKVAEKGHELGNHTLYHPCRESALHAAKHYQSESYDTVSITKEIDMMNKILFGIDGKTSRTYAYPCTETSVGGQDYAGKLKGLAKYARIGGNENSIITSFNNLDPYRIPSWVVHDNTNEDELINFVKDVVSKGGLGVIMFHGVGGQYIKVSAEAHEKLLQYLSTYKKDVWVGTFQEVLDYAYKN